MLHRFDPLVRMIASAIYRNLPRNIERCDMIAAGRRGLWDAIVRRKDDVDAFDAYARIRIRGAIMDELRTQDWLPRRARVRAELEGVDWPVVIKFDELPENWEQGHAPDHAAEIDRENLHERAAMLLFRLPERERHVLCEHYINGKKMKDIGAALGVSQARASQIHARALNRMRALLTGEQPAHNKAGKPRAR